MLEVPHASRCVLYVNLYDTWKEMCGIVVKNIPQEGIVFSILLMPPAVRRHGKDGHDSTAVAAAKHVVV